MSRIRIDVLRPKVVTVISHRHAADTDHAPLPSVELRLRSRSFRVAPLVRDESLTRAAPRGPVKARHALSKRMCDSAQRTSRALSSVEVSDLPAPGDWSTRHDELSAFLRLAVKPLRRQGDFGFCATLQRAIFCFMQLFAPGGYTQARFFRRARVSRMRHEMRLPQPWPDSDEQYSVCVNE